MDSVEDGSSPAPVSKTPADPAENVYCFGMLLLEVITGRLPDSEEHGSLIDWVISCNACLVNFDSLPL